VFVDINSTCHISDSTCLWSASVV